MAVSRCKVHSQQVSSKVQKSAMTTHTTLDALDKEATREILQGQHKEGRYRGNQNENRVLYNYARGECSATEHGTLKAAVDKALHDHGITKVRKDAVVAESMYCSVADWRDYTGPEADALVADVRADAEGRGLLVVDIRLHLDEATPHLHVTSVPIVWDDEHLRYKLAAVTLMAYTTTEAMAWQEKMWHQVAEPRGYKRPDLGKSSTKNYVKKTSQEAAAARAEAKAAKEELAEINERLELARRLEETIDRGPVAIAAEGIRIAQDGRAADERAECARAGQGELAAEVEDLAERVAAAERERDAARDRERAARTRFGQLAERARSVLMDLQRLPQRVYNSLCAEARRHADKIGLNPTLAGFAGYGRRVTWAEPSAYERRRNRGVFASLLDMEAPEPRRPGELKQAKNKPKQPEREAETPNKLNKLAEATARAQAINDSRGGRGGRLDRSAER